MELLSPSSTLFTTTNILIGITVAISLYAFNNGKVMQDLIMNPYVIHTRHQYYRFLTSGFIHGDHMHLIFNMVSLYFFGPNIETIFGLIFGSMGTVYYLALYLLGIIISDVPTYFKHRHNPRYNALGASGGVTSVIFSFILFDPLGKIGLYFFIPVPGFIFAVLYVIFSVYQGRRGGDNINHDAHLYGALFGIAFCMILYPPVIGYFVDQITRWDGKFF
jgi:membrane associated rhomboid family serine protease